MYDNSDITELAKVFTGLYSPELNSRVSLEERIPLIISGVTKPLSVNDDFHSLESKSFLGYTIPVNTPAEQSISLALDYILAHQNIGPFVSRQLIQRFTTSNPSSGYIARVTQAFNQGLFELPDGTVVGDGRKGDLKATISAILFDQETDSDDALLNDQFGKVREPVLRLTHFMRAFNVNMQNPEYLGLLIDTSAFSALGQHPYRSPSVFNFYRPGYIAPGTLSADLGLVVPEFQITNAMLASGANAGKTEFTTLATTGVGPFLNRQYRKSVSSFFKWICGYHGIRRTQQV